MESETVEQPTVPLDLSETSDPSDAPAPRFGRMEMHKGANIAQAVGYEVVLCAIEGQPAPTPGVKLRLLQSGTTFETPLIVLAPDVAKKLAEILLKYLAIGEDQGAELLAKAKQHFDEAAASRQPLSPPPPIDPPLSTRGRGAGGEGGLAGGEVPPIGRYRH